MFLFRYRFALRIRSFYTLDSSYSYGSKYTYILYIGGHKKDVDKPIDSVLV